MLCIHSYKSEMSILPSINATCRVQSSILRFRTRTKRKISVHVPYNGDYDEQEEWDNLVVPWIVKWTSLAAVIALPNGEIGPGDAYDRCELVKLGFGTSEEYPSEPARDKQRAVWRDQLG